MSLSNFQKHDELRTQVEYSKSGRSSCKGCKGTIKQDTIRVGLEKKSRVFDGYDVYWYHLKCFKFPSPFYLNQLKHFELLRWEDQMQIRDLLKDETEIKDAMQKQNYYNDVWKIKDSLLDELKPGVIKKIYLDNYCLDGLSPAYVQHCVADGMAYGRIGPCPTCNNLSILYDGTNYYCKGWVTIFTRCDWHGSDIKRYRFILNKEGIPNKYIQSFEFNHLHPIHVLNDYVAPSHTTVGPGVVAGGAAGSDGSSLSTPSTGISAFRAEPFNPNSIFLKVNDTFISTFTKKSAVEIYQEYNSTYGHVAYNVSLNLVDITYNNSFYILQLIKSSKQYHVFCMWGRIGHPSGGSTYHDHSTLGDAKAEFNERFKDKTGFEWEQRSGFSKIPGKYFIVDLEEDHHDSGSSEIPVQADTRTSSLDPKVQELVHTMFDPELMKSQLARFKLDQKKMPLGKISQKQIKTGYQVLTEIQDLIADPTTPRNKLVDASTRFYTFIPHDFGGSLPPIIDNKTLLLEKMRLVDTMAEVEVANNLRKLSAQTSSGNSLDDNYKVLKSHIEPLDQSSYLFKQLQEFALSTVDTDQYTVDIVHIFKVVRQGELEKYQQWSFSPNRMLLWHGSRITNWSGILSQGLRIAPPEAPKTGYRFGKGVYHADATSTSLMYCPTSKDTNNNVAILALNEVALGNSEALFDDSYMESANFGYQSTKAMGMRGPTLFDEIQDATVLKGPVIASSVVSSCTHNEYVVYDTTQINIKYLFYVKVNYN
ncbi:hypothetical protein CYY_004711 [Polysphondylium violaceum]|uniref:Poly [ADP-ribose] polymerase n=1 Tax=Polysphondylium violaceum TaxID=133409 RepID=A0A8J4USS7_9MYCE|nr:hypothetical protein CYY_004711 [Polysphondylium violaceum]